MKKVLIITALALGVSALCVMAQEDDGPPQGPQGQPGGQRMQPGMHQMMQQPMMAPDRLKELGATDAQIEALQKIQLDEKEKGIDLRAKVEKAQLALDRLLQSTTPDESATMKAVDELNQARDEMFKQHVATQLKVKQTLGADLSKKMQEQRRPMRPDGGMRSGGFGGAQSGQGGRPVGPPPGEESDE